MHVNIPFSYVRCAERVTTLCRQKIKHGTVEGGVASNVGETREVRLSLGYTDNLAVEHHPLTIEEWLRRHPFARKA